MLKAIMGGLGWGKTLKMVQVGIDARAKGYNIYTNFKLENPKYGPLVNYTMLHEPMEIMDLPTDRFNVVLGDEFYTWFDCYESSPLIKTAMRNVINATRKKHITVIATTQSLDQLNWKLRSIIDEFIFPFYFDKEHNHPQSKLYDTLRSDHKAKNINNSALGGFTLDLMYQTVIYKASNYFKYYDTDEIIKGFLDFERKSWKDNKAFAHIDFDQKHLNSM